VNAVVDSVLCHMHKSRVKSTTASSAAGMERQHGSVGCCQKGSAVDMHLYVSARPVDMIALWSAGECVLGK